MSGHKTIFLNVPPSPPVDITFTDLHYRVNQGTFKKEYKEILKGLNGKFKSGELTAIMGPSGAGKSSLLNILTGFLKKGMSGRIEANGVPVDPGVKSNRKRSAYIMQDDQLNPLFNVVEIMMHAANLKLGSALANKSKAYLIEDLLDNLGMAESKTTRCCRLSGGQRKRLSIALELIDNPSVLYLDEPTSGLDSSSSVQLISLLKKLALEGRTIICTIHQPSATIFEMFDHIYVVCEGKCIYQGASENVVPFLASVNLPCPMYHNPADFLMDVVSGEFGIYTDRLMIANDAGWRESKDKAHHVLEVTVSDRNCNIKGLTKQAVMISNPSEWSRYKSLVPKIILQFHRDWTVTYLKLVLHILVSLVVGLIFYNIGDDASKVLSNLGYIFIVIAYLTFTSLMPAALKFPSEIKIIRKENFNNWYTFKTYFSAFMTVNIPVQLIFTLVFTCITYYMTSQILDPSRFLMLLGTAFGLTIIAELIGLLMGTCSNPVNGVFNGSVLMAAFLLLSGFLAFLNHMPRPLYYLSFGAFFRYAFELMAIALYGWDRKSLACAEEEFYCHMKNPKMIFTEFGLSEDSITFDSVAMVIYSTVCGVLAFHRLRERLKQTV